MNALFASSSSKVLSVYLDEPTKIHTPGERLSGVATLRREVDVKGKGTTKLSELTASLRCDMTTTFAKATKDKKNPDKGAEVTRLHTSDQVLWRAEDLLSSSSPSGTELVKVPFTFTLPSAALRLPPSFEGGSRTASSVEGQSVARVIYFIKFVLRKASLLTPDVRLIVPFVIMPPPSTSPTPIPPPLLPRSLPSGLPTSSPSPPQGWYTTTAQKDYKDSFLAQPKRVIVSLSLPTLPSWPLGASIPYRLSLLLLSPQLYAIDPSSPSSSPPPLPPPPLSSLKLSLVRDVFVQAHGKSQVLHQTVGTASLLDGLENEPRTWWGTQRKREKGEEGEGRWGVEVIVVGEMAVGKEGGLGPSFGGEGTKGMLSCSYRLSLALPLSTKGKKPPSLEVESFVPVVISTALRPGSTPTGGVSAAGGVGSTSDLPPSYLQVEDWPLGEQPKGSVGDAKVVGSP